MNVIVQETVGVACGLYSVQTCIIEGWCSMILRYNDKLYIHALSDARKVTSPGDGSCLRIQIHHVRVFREPGDKNTDKYLSVQSFNL